MAAFDAYLMVDWSATNRPQSGEDNIWYCFIDRRRSELISQNPPTRAKALEEIRGLLSNQVAQGQRTLVGFDFAYGYPSGFARTLGATEQPPWAFTWGYLSEAILDDDANHSNRFEAASFMNARVSGADWPFWGCPPGRTIPYLGPKRPQASSALAELRLAERNSASRERNQFGNSMVPAVSEVKRWSASLI